MEVGREIRRLREKRGWSQAKLAGAAGMGVSGISQIETGVRNPSAVTLAKIAEALGVGVGDLYPKGQSPLPEWGGMAVWERPEDEFLGWLADAPREEVEQLRTEVGELLGVHQARYGPGAPRGFPSLAVAKAHADTPEGQRGRLLHRRAFQLTRWLDHLEEEQARKEAELERLKELEVA